MNPEEQKRWREDHRSMMNVAGEKLLTGLNSLLQSQRWSDYLKFQARFYRYSFGNTLLILAQKPSATLVGSYAFWKSLGRHPRRGTGLQIFVPFHARKEQEPAAEDRADLEGLDEPRQTLPIKEGQGRLRFGVGHVFDVSDTEGAPLPSPVISLLNGDDRGLYTRLTAYAMQVLGATVDELPSLGGANGVCVHGTDGRAIKISILESLPPAQKAKTLAHELGHAHLHTPDEYQGHSLRSRMELEAESISFIILDHFGLDAGDFSFGYLAGWSGGDEKEAIRTMQESGQKIQGVVEKIILWLEDEKPENPPLSADSEAWAENGVKKEATPVAC
jgi:hypothetical protein